MTESGDLGSIPGAHVLLLGTGTHLPEAELGAWQIFKVAGGGVEEKAPGAEVVL